jgi:hypothetical protein
MELQLLQSWLPTPEAGFLPGTADFIWKAGVLDLKVDLIDEEVITTATANQQRLWDHGDVVELFVQRVGESGYREYQIAPNGFTLALYYPDISCVVAVRSGELRMEDFLSDAPLQSSATKTMAGWKASLSVPLHGTPVEKARVSCCRYDAALGRSPIISSTSPHPVRDFHRPQDWREMILMEE